MGGIGMIPLRPLALKLRDAFGIRHFVETGTYKAATTLWAADNFKDVTTIEAHLPYFEAAKANHMDRRNITWAYGNSGEFLRQYLPDEPAIVWLDAHWCGSYEISAGTPGECPIMAELEAINRSPANHFVLIDDARYFLEAPPRPHDPAQWPKFDEVERLLKAKHRRNVYVWNDAIIAVPKKASGVISDVTGINAGMKIVVLTSNDYQHLLTPFAYLFNKYWGANQPVTAIRHENRPRGLPANFVNFAVGIQADYTWSDGLIKYLNYLNEDMLILLLEDYFINQPVNVGRIRDLWAYMERNDSVAKIDLSDDRLKFPHEDYLESGDLGLVRSLDDAPFQTSLQAAIWRKDFLLKFLEPSEGPWQFEKKGTKRVVAARKRGEFDGLILGAKSLPLHYVNAVGGEGRKPGVLDTAKIPAGLMSELSGRGLV